MFNNQQLRLGNTFNDSLYFYGGQSAFNAIMNGDTSRYVYIVKNNGFIRLPAFYFVAMFKKEIQRRAIICP